MNSNLQKIVSITTRNNVKLAPLTNAYIKSFVCGIGMSEEKGEGIARLTGLALERRMRNAYKGIGEITLDILVGLDRLQIEIADQGIPYWIDIQSEQKNHTIKPDAFMVKKLGTEGQRFCMTFFLEPDVDILSFKKQDDVEEVLLDEGFHVHRVQSDEHDITEIMRCIYYNYGFDYPNCRIYETPYLSRVLEAGKQWSYLGINDHGQVLGHVALVFHDEFPGMPEIGSLVSKQFCRGKGVAGHLLSHLCREAEQKGVQGAFSVPVAFHPFSQKLLNKQGFIPVGMILHYLPAKNAWEYADHDRRMDMFVAAKMFYDPGRKTVYVPEKHRAFISGLYRKLNIDHICVTDAEMDKAAPAANQYSVSYDYDLRTAEFLIDHVAGGFEEDLKSTMADFEKKGIELVKVYLNMSDPSAIEAYGILERNGYYFSGIFPGCENGEYMMLGHLMGIPMLWDRIVPVDNYQEVLTYVQQGMLKACETD